MIEKIKGFFSKNILEAEEDTTTPDQIFTIGSNNLVMVIDGDLDEQELKSISGTLSSMLNLNQDQIDELISLSREEVADATSLYQFTKEINAHFDIDKKLSLMTAMWRVAFADGHLDKYEENIIRRVADLLHIRHSEYIQCKVAARDQ